MYVMKIIMKKISFSNEECDQTVMYVICFSRRIKLHGWIHEVRQ